MCDAKVDIKFSLKATVIKKKGKVLFAEVDSGFADVLLSFLTLPLGTIVKILEKHREYIPQEAGSLTSLYTGLANSDHFWGGEGAKSILLHPRSSFDADRQRLKLDISEYYHCPKNCHPFARFQSKSMYFDNPEYCLYCPSSPLKREVVTNETQTQVLCDDRVFMNKALSFLVTDDLHIMPNAGLSEVASVLGDIDIDEAETMNVTFGLHEVMKLCVLSFMSMNPLSVLIFDARLECNKGNKFIPANASNSNSNSKTMNLKLMVQKSTNKLLYAEAEGDFIEFLFSFLIIPIGGVESLLASNSNLKAIDNLYKSVEDLIHNDYFMSLDAKNRLLKPNVPHGYISNNYVFPLTEDRLSEAYRDIGYWPKSSTKFPNGQASYLKGPRTYKVTDDLIVTSFCIASVLATLNEKKVRLSDVEKVELRIGLKEGLSILKASLTSKRALTDALLSQVMTKKPKTEQV